MKILFYELLFLGQESVLTKNISSLPSLKSVLVSMLKINNITGMENYR